MKTLITNSGDTLEVQESFFAKLYSEFMSGIAFALIRYKGQPYMIDCEKTFFHLR